MNRARGSVGGQSSQSTPQSSQARAKVVTVKKYMSVTCPLQGVHLQATKRSRCCNKTITVDMDEYEGKELAEVRADLAGRMSQHLTSSHNMSWEEAEVEIDANATWQQWEETETTRSPIPEVDEDVPLTTVSVEILSSMSNRDLTRLLHMVRREVSVRGIAV
jgi:hypothetical protein